MQTPTSRSLTRRRWPRFLATGATAALAATAVASTAGAATTSNAPGGATGSVAALNASSMEVQNPASGQTTVNWTSTTQFSKTVSEAVSSLSTGDCVSVTGTQSKKSKTTIAARSISVSTPAPSGACTGPGARATIPGAAGGGAGGFQFRGGGGGESGFGKGGGTRPSFPTGGSGASNFRKQLASLAFASGKVTAVNGSTVTVSGINVSPSSLPRRTSKSGSQSSKSAKKPTLPKTQTLKITTSSSTTLNATQSAAASDLAVGDCVSAFGPAANNGAVTATTVRISMPSGGSCTGGFGRFAGGGGGFSGGGPGGPGGSGA
jgi:hypothetical protein